MSKFNNIYFLQVVRNFIACLMIGVVFLTGCSGEDILNKVFPDSDAIASQEVSPAVDPQIGLNNTLEPAYSPPPLKKILIWLTPQFDPSADTESGKLLLEQITSFQDAFPEVEVEIREKSEFGPSSLVNTLTAAAVVAPDALPSIVLIPQSKLEKMAAQGIILPLTEMESNFKEDDWFPSVISMGKSSGEIFCIPLAADAVGLISTKSNINQEYISLSAVSGTNLPIMFAAGDPDSMIPELYYQSIGGKFIDDQGHLSIDLDLMTEMLTALETNRISGAFPVGITDFQSEDQLWSALESGEIENMISWGSRVFSASNDYTLSPLPGISDHGYTYARGWVWCLIDQNIYNIDASLRFIEHMVEPTFLLNWTPTSGFLPVRPSSIQGWDEPLQANLHAIMSSAVQLPSETVLEVIKSDMVNTVLDVLQGRSTPEESSQTLMEIIEEKQTE